jgi:hypothetical protein
MSRICERGKIRKVENDNLPDTLSEEELTIMIAQINIIIDRSVAEYEESDNTVVDENEEDFDE